MQKLKQPVTLETAFGPYVVTEFIGEGGAGRVYGGIGPDGASVAVKVLSKDRATTDRRRRFKNEIAFLLRNRHTNIVSVTDHGLATDKAISGPFYVMRRYDTNLRDLIRRGITTESVLPLFAKILDGVDAAHLQGAIHRDLKPENILFDSKAKVPAIADFGIASFTADLVVTAVETLPTQRLANFQYAAPEQRIAGREAGMPADIYALGLILNELFTGNVPHGTEYQAIGATHKAYSYLDAVVARMIRQNASERHPSIAELRGAIAHHHAEFESIQKLSAIDATVIRAGEIDDPLAFNPPKIVAASWDNGQLILKFDREITHAWISALHNMGSYSSVMNAGPERFQFRGNEARVPVRDSDAQRAIDHFKDWLPRATQRLKYDLEQDLQQQQRERTEKLRHERAIEEQRLRVNQNLKI